MRLDRVIPFACILLILTYANINYMRQLLHTGKIDDTLNPNANKEKLLGIQRERTGNSPSTSSQESDKSLGYNIDTYVSDESVRGGDNDDKLKNLLKNKKHYSSIDDYITHLKQKQYRFLVVQTDDRLHQLFHPEDDKRSLQDTNQIINNQNFSLNHIACSVLAISNWAREKGYAYLFVDPLIRYPNVPSIVKGPYGNQTISGYWNKVPTVLDAFYIAKRAGVEYVLYVDADVSPNLGNEFDLTLEEMIQASHNNLLRENKSFDDIHFIVTPDVQLWSWMLIHHGTYGGNEMSAINSGTFMFRVSDSSKSILKQWWYNETQHTTPFELANYPIKFHFSINITKVDGDDVPNIFSKRYNWQKLLVETDKNEYVKRHAAIVQETGSDWACCDKASNLISAKLSKTLIFRSTNQDYYPEMMKKCCEQSCINIILEEITALVSSKFTAFVKVNEFETRCEKITNTEDIKKSMGNVHLPNTLIKWPGEQDRFNYLYYKNKNIMYRPWYKNLDDVIPSWCSKQIGKKISKILLLHWCDSYARKISFSKIMSSQLEAKLNQNGKNWEQYAWEVLNDTIFVTGYHGFDN